MTVLLGVDGPGVLYDTSFKLCWTLSLCKNTIIKVLYHWASPYTRNWWWCTVDCGWVYHKSENIDKSIVVWLCAMQHITCRLIRFHLYLLIQFEFVCTTYIFSWMSCFFFFILLFNSHTTILLSMWEQSFKHEYFPESKFCQIRYHSCLYS
jgi:hypothetical protein